MIIPNIWENKIDVPNHQPALDAFGISTIPVWQISGMMVDFKIQHFESFKLEIQAKKLATNSLACQIGLGNSNSLLRDRSMKPPQYSKKTT